MIKKLDYTKPVKTRGGSQVKIYEIFYQDYCNGAWLEPDREVWIPAQWDFQGMYTDKPTALDLINV